MSLKPKPNETKVPTIRSRLDAKLLSNKVFTDLSEFELNNDENDSETMLSLFEHIKDQLSKNECSNIGNIKWNKSLLDKILTSVVAPSIKQTFEAIKKQLILNNEISSEKYPNDFTYCLLCRDVYTLDESNIDEVKENQTNSEIETLIQQPETQIKIETLKKQEKPPNGVEYRSRIYLEIHFKTFFTPIITLDKK
jgi:hypothetical protein